MNSPATSTSVAFSCFHIAQKLRRNLRDGNVVDVDVLLANQVQQQVQRPVVDLPDRHRKRKLLDVFLGLLPGRGLVGLLFLDRKRIELRRRHRRRRQHQHRPRPRYRPRTRHGRRLHLRLGLFYLVWRVVGLLRHRPSIKACPSQPVLYSPSVAPLGRTVSAIASFTWAIVSSALCAARTLPASRISIAWLAV